MRKVFKKFPCKLLSEMHETIKSASWLCYAKKQNYTYITLKHFGYQKEHIKKLYG